MEISHPDYATLYGLRSKEARQSDGKHSITLHPTVNENLLLDQPTQIEVSRNILS